MLHAVGVAMEDVRASAPRPVRRAACFADTGSPDCGPASGSYQVPHSSTYRPTLLVRVVLVHDRPRACVTSSSMRDGMVQRRGPCIFSEACRRTLVLPAPWERVVVQRVRIHVLAPLATASLRSSDSRRHSRRWRSLPDVLSRGALMNVCELPIEIREDIPAACCRRSPTSRCRRRSRGAFKACRGRSSGACSASVDFVSDVMYSTHSAISCGRARADVAGDVGVGADQLGEIQELVRAERIRLFDARPRSC